MLTDSLLSRLNLHSDSRKLLLMLLLADGAFMLIHLAYELQFLPNPLFSIERDFGYAEVYQYLKEGWIVVLLLLAALFSRRIIYLAWAGLFMYLLMDDSLRIHETLGGHLTTLLDLQPMFNLRAKDFGELGVSLIFAAFLFAIIGLAYCFSERRSREVSRTLFIGVLLLALFGVVIDFVHNLLPLSPAFSALLEDGGEMVIMSIILCYVFTLH